MTTITREEVKAFIEQIESDLANGWEAQIFELKLARIALASLEAKPVAWECGENIILFNPDTVEAYAKRVEISPKPLYAAPPAPVVPEKMNFSTACNFVQINGMAKEDRATLAMRAWNACRTAMLNGGKS
ncbi:hypothetical protein GHW86_02095 [Salmonella enterica]|nr:hypothetical protein [Salmonella enterica]EDN2102010.1 hypothetical protein [Salmonella enterica]EDO3722616.1 hypothetical protein [Salmonella enterica]EEA1748316.1 hypothetical protein [Salmonella enterica]EEF4301446.1 hypothetical protein [Salmonella enterica]